jgi:hypothetical protein
MANVQVTAFETLPADFAAQVKSILKAYPGPRGRQ